MLQMANKEVWTFNAYEDKVDIEESVYLAGPDGPRRTMQLVIYGRARKVMRVQWSFAPHVIRLAVRGNGISGIHENTNDRGLGQNLTQQAEPLGRRLIIGGCHPGQISSRTIETLNESYFDRVGADGEHNRDRGGRGLGRQRRLSTTGRDDDGHLTTNQIGHKRRQATW